MQPVPLPGEALSKVSDGPTTNVLILNPFLRRSKLQTQRILLRYTSTLVRWTLWNSRWTSQTIWQCTFITLLSIVYFLQNPHCSVAELYSRQSPSLCAQSTVTATLC